MKYHISQTEHTAAYLQLYRELRSDIVDGVYPYGAKLPSKRMMAEEIGVSVITVQHSYAILCDEGYIEPRQRSGYYVIYKKDDFLSSNIEETITIEETVNIEKTAGIEKTADIAETVEAAKRSGAGKTNGIAEPRENSVFPFSVLAKTMRKVLTEQGDTILQRSPNQGCMQLRQAISAYLFRSNGMSVPPQQIVIGSGAEYLYGLVVQLLGNERIFALEDPSYEKIRQVYEANGVICDALRMGKHGIRSSELERTQATVLHVTPFNSYPSFITATVSKRYEYLKWIRERNGYLIEDNYASELTVSKKMDDTVFSMAETESVIYINTFSQTIAPAVRVGYMVLPPSLVARFEERLGFYSCTVPVFEQFVVAELIKSGDFERHINRVRRAKRKER